MWKRGWRDEVWGRLGDAWDVAVIGGGITGAGILAEASRAGLKAVLIEAKDFASGTSSRSTKLVHGGLRYLRNGQVRLTRESVRERERLLKEAAGLVEPLGFYLTSFESDQMPGWMFGAGLAIYDVLARKWAHTRLEASEMFAKVPVLDGTKIKSAYHYYDAQTDDARLVVRVLREAVRHGGVAINYARAVNLLKSKRGYVRGVAVRDEVSGRTAEIKARVVINATGAWADDVREKLGVARKLRAIRGSHLVFPRSRIPIDAAITLLHPRDGRAVFAVPWEGVTLIGTTDIDHGNDLATEPAMSSQEAEYILELARHAFPKLDITSKDVRSSYSGVRSVVDTGVRDPSKESRDHAIWRENGLLTVTGGKLTTFRVMAKDALKEVRDVLPPIATDGTILDDAPPPADSRLDATQVARLHGRFGGEAAAVLDGAREDVARIGDTPALWAEIRWAARTEAVVHLEDLLLRRVRLGLLLGEQTFAEMPRIRRLAQSELGWDDATWEREERAFRDVWTRAYAPPR
jgi:glycerol-3-phosphate dehydrogenase